MNWLSAVATNAMQSSPCKYLPVDDGQSASNPKSWSCPPGVVPPKSVSYSPLPSKLKIPIPVIGKSLIAELQEAPRIMWVTPGLVTWIIAYFVGRSLGRSEGAG